MENILILTDGSDCSEKAEREGIQLAEQLQLNQLQALTILERFPNDNVTYPTGITEEVYNAERESAEQSVKRVQTMGKENGIQVQPHIVKSETPVQAINNFLEEHDIDLVVMGTHGRSGLEHFFLGSTTERLLRSSSTPVLAIPSRD